MLLKYKNLLIGLMSFCVVSCLGSDAFSGNKFIEIDRLVATSESTTASGAITLAYTSKSIQLIDPNGSDRNVGLPAEAISNRLIFQIINTANGAGEDLVIRDDTPTTLTTLGPGMGCFATCNGTAWKVVNYTPSAGAYWDSVNGNYTATGTIYGATYGSDGSITDAELKGIDDGATTQIPVGGGAGSAPVWTTATGTGAPVRAGSPTFTTTITTPNIYGSAADNGDITIEGTSSATKTTSYVILQPTGGNVGIGTTNPLGKLHVASYPVYLGDTDDGTVKRAYIIGTQYNHSSEPEGYMVSGGASDSAADNKVNFGGGVSGYNAATQLSFYTAANNTTRTGTERVRINSTGNVGIGTTNPGGKLTIQQLSNVADGGINITNTASNNTRMFMDSADAFHIENVGVANGFVLKSGNVGIGTTEPTTKLDTLAADNTTAQTITINATQANVTAADTFMDFRSTTGSEATIAGTAVPGVVTYTTFQGSHYTEVVAKEGLLPNMLLEIIDATPVFTRQLNTPEKSELKLQNVLEGGKKVIESVSKPDSSQVRTITLKTKEVLVTTPATYYQAAPKEHLFKTRICMTKASKRAVGVYVGTDKEGRDMVASIGTGWMYVANKGKDIEVGDYLISSDIFGCSELQPDDIYRNTTVAKATQGVIWKTGQKTALIRCIYLGG